MLSLNEVLKICILLNKHGTGTALIVLVLINAVLIVLVLINAVLIGLVNMAS